MSAIATAHYGMMAAMRRFEASAQATARGGDYVREAVEQISAKQAFKASAAVLRTADEMLGMVLDLKS
ncbi:MAG: flagellar hook protein FlgE [Caulobacteraceae bacterium]|nr:flagellar hook protein FlgE [Caulobacteraceae bacterium]